MELDIDLPDFGPFEGGAPVSEFSSPDNPVFGLDLSGSLHSSVMSVSPTELLLTENLMSAPGSTALTHLTTPSGYDTSPAFTEDWNASPLFAQNDFETAQEWPSLFPDAETSAAPAPALAAPAPVPAAQAEDSPSVDSEDFEPARRPSQARKSSASSSPSGRHSSVSGVSARRRGKPLPPITIDDPSDTVGMKRAKNTLAARKSRARKAERMDELERQVRELEAEKEKLAAELAHWKSLASSQGAAGQ
uniref:Cross-pathway control protein 1 n=1 Tax=Cryphonectria parasitica TaxID=5116 RepID=CPC1_CRYPA|nr:RecName: Full=Cross-pathway control protein 1 [Cryphonectria parasitica]AAC16255.1 cross-pathway control protein 1 [Cryphonectria parasitica]